MLLTNWAVLNSRSKKEELKWVNAYGHDVAKINGQKYTKIKHPGKQTVTGVQATGYCRVRYTKGGDFTRCRTTANRPSGYFCQGKKSSPTALISAMNKIFPQIYTSLIDIGHPVTHEVPAFL